MEQQSATVNPHRLHRNAGGCCQMNTHAEHQPTRWCVENHIHICSIHYNILLVFVKRHSCLQFIYKRKSRECLWKMICDILLVGRVSWIFPIWIIPFCKVLASLYWHKNKTTEMGKNTAENVDASKGRRNENRRRM